MLTKIEMQYMEAVIAMNRRMRDHEVDWEQRRYEIAKDIYPIACHDMNTLESKDAPAKAAVELADLLIAELKKEPKK
jgi:hypothetical protein